MSDLTAYWKDLVSIALRFLQAQGNADAVFVIKNASLDIEWNSYDNWNSGIDYWDLGFQLKYKDFTALGDRKNSIEETILETLERFHVDNNNLIANVIIRPMIERYIDWEAILPKTKEDAIRLVQDEQRVLTDVATGKLSFKEDGTEELYQTRHQRIIEIARKTGFDYPIEANSLVEWWAEVKGMQTYADRRDYISKLFTPLIKELRESDEDLTLVNFHQMATSSGSVQKAIADAEQFIRDGKFDSAVDRVHTAIHGYLREVLSSHNIAYAAEESLPALYTRLHSCYGSSIQPHDVGNRIKAVLRSAGGMINAVNELRNNNTVAHPNGQLIQAREAKLVICLVIAIVDYIEAVEMTYGRNER